MRLVLGEEVKRSLPWNKRASAAMEAAWHGEDNVFDFSKHWATATMATAVACVSLLAVSVYVILRRRRKAGSPLEPVPPKLPSFHMPPIKLETGPLRVERAQPAMTRLSLGCVLEPVQRVKARGLLERRGSNASLTIDLPESSGPSLVQVSPPKECSTVEYLTSVGNRLTRRQLRAALADPSALAAEFIDVPLNHPPKASLPPGVAHKNRYDSILPNPHSAVTLCNSADAASAYINANYVRGYEDDSRAFVATQGPLPSTVNDFWRMVWQERSPIIVCLTKIKEGERSKCEPYLPLREESYGEVDVMVTATATRNGYTVKDLLLQKGNDIRHLKHFWHASWPDGSAPLGQQTAAYDVLHLATEVDEERQRASSQGPVVVHCSAGIGRTGAFIGAYVGMWMLKEENMVDVLGILCQLRMDRGGMVQSPDQYLFLHSLLALFEKDLPDTPRSSSGEGGATAMRTEGSSPPRRPALPPFPGSSAAPRSFQAFASSSPRAFSRRSPQGSQTSPQAMVSSPPSSTTSPQSLTPPEPMTTS